MGLSFLRRSIVLAIQLAIGVGLCPVPVEAQNPAEHRATLPARKNGKLRGQDLAQERIEASRIWFGGEASPAYLDAKARLSRQELERWSPQGGKVLQAAPSASATWTNLGPKANLISTSYPDIDSGRLNAIVTHPTNPSLLYIATATGGVFKCTNADLTSASDWTWTPITDSLPNSSSSGNIPVGAMAMSPTDPNTLYIGLGDFVDDTARGFYRSTDGGDTWTEATGIGAATRTTCILPLSASVVLWGTNDGLKRSTDGGQTFTTMNVGGTGNWAWSAIAFSPTEVAIVRSTLRTGYRFYFQSGGIYWSGDAGATWTLGSVTGLASFGRVSLAAASDGSTAWGLAEDASVTGSMAKGLLKTTDKGHTWTFVAAPTISGGLFQGIGNQMTGDGSQAGYNHAIAVHPSNANQVTVGANLALYRTDDGGLSWNQLTHWYGNRHVYAHADFHCTAWSQTSSPVLFVGNDGGLCILRNPAIAVASIPTGVSSVPSDITFIDNRRNKGLVSHQAYHLGSTTAATPSGAKNSITLGLQDNGTRVRQDMGSGLALSSTFEDQIGGDGFGTVIHPLDGNLMLGSYYYDAILKSTNGGITAFVSAATGITESGVSASAPFSTRLALGEADATGNTVYTFANTVVYKTVNFATSWTAMPMTGFLASYTIRQINAAKSDPNTVAVVTSSGSGFKTTNAGGAWTQFGAMPNNGLSMSYVWFDTSNAQIIYVSSVALSSTSNHLWKSTDGGTTWTALDGNPGFPFGIPVHVIKNDPSTPTTLLAGTDFGVYQSTNGGATWARYGQGLPMVSVRDLYIAADGSFVRVATYGRGVWELVTAAAVPSVALSPTTATVVHGGTQTFTPTVTSGTANTVTWTASTGTVPATATASGTAQTYFAPASGSTATVTATTVDTPAASTNATVTLVAPSAVTVAVSPATLEMMVSSGTQQFTGTVSTITNTGLTWTVTGGTGISASGLFTATGLAAGSYTVTAASSSLASLTGTATVTLVAASSVTVAVSPAATPVLVGATKQFTATVTGLSTPNQSVTWSVSGGGTVNTSGLFTATTAGTFTVTATNAFSGKTGTTSVTVSTPASVSLTPTAATLVLGGTQTFTPTVTGGATNTVTWTASSGSITATATATGVAQTYTAPASGSSATVTATSVDSPSITAAATVTLVAPSAVTVTVNPATAELMVGSGTQQFTSALTPLTNQSVTWSGTGVGSNGLFSASSLAAGSYTVTATSQAAATRSGTATVTLVSPSAVTVTVTPSSYTTLPGVTQQFSAAVTGLSAANQGVTWLTSGGGAISSTGLFTPITVGNYTITATNAFSGKTGTATSYVRNPDLNGDGVIDLLDLLTLAKNHGSTNVGSDLVPNGTVDDADLTFLLNLL